MPRNFALALLFVVLLSPPAPAVASSQVAVILFFCSVVAVVPGPWQQLWQQASSQKHTLVPELSLFLFRMLLIIFSASIVRKIARVDSGRFASLSGYAVPAMSLALLVDQSRRQPVIDMLSLSSATSSLLSACSSVLPFDYVQVMISRSLTAVQQPIYGQHAANYESQVAAVLLVVSTVTVLLIFRALWAALKLSVASLGSGTLAAAILSQLSASFILPRLPNLKSSYACCLCVAQLLIAPYLRHRSLPLPTEYNRTMFILCVIPMAMTCSSEAVQASVLMQAALDVIALTTYGSGFSVTASHPPTTSRKHSLFCWFIFVLAALDVFYLHIATPYVFELVKSCYYQTMDLNLTFIVVFVLSWCANYDAGFPVLLVVLMALVLPSLDG
jgi:hypothetical protein